jgi:CheY-like chemotaxis protein
MARTISSAARRIGPVLLVDDYADARQSVGEALENAGYRVVEAADGQEALDLLVTDERFALIILDLQMPVMDGWQLLEVLKRYVRLSVIPVIIVTALEPRLEQLEHPNIFACLRAPYRLEELVEMVDACMAGARRCISTQAPPKNGVGG